MNLSPNGRLRRVYPRVYGETLNISEDGVTLEGLSPRVRGNPDEKCSVKRWLGSIPACTGKPLIRNRFVRSTRVYPRVYGETGRQSPDGADAAGLSPRVRGNP